jgi:hypothetical protein
MGIGAWLLIIAFLICIYWFGQTESPTVREVLVGVMFLMLIGRLVLALSRVFGRADKENQLG